MKRNFLFFFILGLAIVRLAAATAQAGDPLPSWNAGKSKKVGD